VYRKLRRARRTGDSEHSSCVVGLAWFEGLVSWVVELSLLVIDIH